MATTPRDAVVFTLECGTDVVLVDITPTELIKAAKEVGASAESGVAGIKVTRAALCQSIVKVGAKVVGYSDLTGKGISRYVPRTRDVMQLAKVFTARHSPTEDEAAAVMASVVCEASDEPRWLAVLPGVKADNQPSADAVAWAREPRTIVFAEVDPETVEAALAEAMLSAKSETARGLQGLISGCGRSIRSVDGVPVNRDTLKGAGWDALFSVKETHLLGSVYSYIHGTDGEPVGEVRPVSR